MKNLRMVRGEISQEWADGVSGNFVYGASHDYVHRSGKSQKYLTTFNYDSLGSIKPLVSEKVFSAQAIRRFARYRHGAIINAAGEEPARLTSTALLLSAVLERPESQLDQSISEEAGFEGLLGKYRQDGNDTWAIPDSAIMIVEGIQPVELQLPHQA